MDAGSRREKEMNAMEDDNKLFLGIGVVIGIIFGALILLFFIIIAYDAPEEKPNDSTRNTQVLCRSMTGRAQP